MSRKKQWGWTWGKARNEHRQLAGYGRRKGVKRQGSHAPRDGTATYRLSETPLCSRLAATLGPPM